MFKNKRNKVIGFTAPHTCCICGISEGGGIAITEENKEFFPLTKATENYTCLTCISFGARLKHFLNEIKQEDLDAK